MRRTILVVALAVVPAAGALAAHTGELGIGAALGEPMGVTAKWWYNERFAFAGGVGYGNAAVFHADVLFNDWTLAPQSPNWRRNLYVGAGPRLATDDDGQFAIRTIAGIGFWPKGRPFELYAEAGPTFKVSPGDRRVGFDGALGFRYYFRVTTSALRGSPSP